MNASPTTQPAPIRDLAVLVKMFPKLSETFILEEILGLERMGVNLQIYALSPPTDAVSHAAVSEVRAGVTQVPVVRWMNTLHFVVAHARALAASPLAYLSAFASSMQTGAGWKCFSQAAWLARALRRDGRTHLHVHFISSTADVAQLAAGMASLPFSVSAHAKDIYLSDRDNLRRKLQAARFTVTCTKFNADTLSAIAPAARVHRMYHGVDRRKFVGGDRGSACSVPLLLSVGRLRAKKGLDLLIDACLLLRNAGRSFRCEIVGYGEEREALFRRIEAHGLNETVHLLGKMTREQVIDRYRSATVYVQPSRITEDGDRDGIPNVLLEAMAMELPVVASDVSGIPELIEHDRNGLLVPPEDPRSLAAAIESLLVNGETGGRLGEAARRTVTERFDNDLNLQLLCRLLRDSALQGQPAVGDVTASFRAQSITK